MRLVSGQGRPYYACVRIPHPRVSAITAVPPIPTLTCTSCSMINTQAFSLLHCSACNNTSFQWSCACAHVDGRLSAAPAPLQSYSTPMRPAAQFTAATPSPTPQARAAPRLAPAAPARSTRVPEPLTPPHAREYARSIPVHEVQSPVSMQTSSCSSSSSSSSSSIAPTSSRRPRRLDLTKKTWVEQIKYIGPLGKNTEYHKLTCPSANQAEIRVAPIDFAIAYNLKPALCCRDAF